MSFILSYLLAPVIILAILLISGYFLSKKEKVEKKFFIYSNQYKPYRIIIYFFLTILSVLICIFIHASTKEKAAISPFITLIATLTTLIFTIIIASEGNTNNTNNVNKNINLTSRNTRVSLIIELIYKNYQLFISDAKTKNKIEKLYDDVFNDLHESEIKLTRLTNCISNIGYTTDNKNKFYTLLNNEKEKFINNISTSSNNKETEEAKINDLFKPLLIFFGEDSTENSTENNKRISILFLYIYKSEQYNKLTKKSKQFIVKNKNSNELYTFIKTNKMFDPIDSYYNAKKNITAINKNATYDDLFETCEYIYSKAYNECGHFFRHTHRIIKMINHLSLTDNEESNEIKAELIGILRAQYSEKILLSIYYNSTYTSKGIGLGYQLSKLEFFGNTSDIEENMHIQLDSLGKKELDEIIIKNSYQIKNYKSISEFKESLQKFN